jgi:hypothetical protein
MRIIAVALLAGSLSLLQVAVGVSQFQHGRKQLPPTSTRTPNQSMTTMGGFPDDPGIMDSMERERRAKYNRERQDRIVADSRRLVQLSRELQEEIERAGDGTLPVSLFKKTDEIIKLAKSVRDKMRRD